MHLVLRVNMKSSVGVYIATSNRVELFERALRSLISQTIKPEQVSVVINGFPSTFSDYRSVIGKYNDFLQIKAVYNDEPLSPGLAKNIALSNLNTFFSTGLDDDDYFLSERIEGFLKKYDTVQSMDNLVLFSNQTLLQFDSVSCIKRPEEVSLTMLMKKNFIGNQVFGATNFLQEINYKDLKVIDDYDFAIRLAGANAKFINVDNFSYVWDKSHNISSVTNTYSGVFKEVYNLMCDEYISSYGSDCIKFRYGRFDYPNAILTINDFIDSNFYKYGLLKVVKQQLKRIL